MLVCLILSLAAADGSTRTHHDALTVVGTWLIDAYQRTLSRAQASNTCNFQPSCSQFTRIAIGEHGLPIGVLLGADRLTRCNPYAWTLLGSYYDSVCNDRLYDPVWKHLPFSRPRQTVTTFLTPPPTASDSDGGRCTEFRFADWLYSNGNYRAAATEYLRVRFSTTDTLTRQLAGLLAAESFLAAGATDMALHAFDDCSEPGIATFCDYGRARAWFVQGNYDSVIAITERIKQAPPVQDINPRLLQAWALLRLRRFPAARATLADAANTDSQQLAKLIPPRPRYKSRIAASLLSALLPGAGQLYAGRAGDAAYTFMAVVGPTAIACWYAADQRRRDPTRIKTVLFGLTAGTFYFGGVYGANTAARDYNDLQESKYVRQADIIIGRMNLVPNYRSNTEGGSN